MCNLSIVLIRSSHIDETYYEALTQAGFRVDVIDARDFILQTDKFKSFNIIIIDNTSPLLEECIQHAKAATLDTLLFVESEFDIFSIDLLNTGPVLMIPTPESKKQAVDYLQRFSKFRKTSIAKEHDFCKKTKIVNMAVGILMINNKIKSNDAYNKLRMIARQRRLKVENISQEVILGAKCATEYGCSFIRSFDDESGSKQCDKLCQHHALMSEETNIALQTQW